jgi:hypothetical protein
MDSGNGVKNKVGSKERRDWCAAAGKRVFEGTLEQPLQSRVAQSKRPLE